MPRRDWQVRPLGEVCRWVNGSQLPEGCLLPEGKHQVHGAGSVMGYAATRNVEDPVVVIGRVGTVGKPRFCPAGCWLNNNAVGLVADPSLVLPPLLALLAETLSWASVCGGTAQSFVKKGHLLETEVAIPTIPEQLRIVDLVEAAGRYIETLRAELSALEAVRAGLVSHHIAHGTPKEPIGKVLTPRRNGFTIDENLLYTQVTVAGRGGGMRLRELKRGIEIGTKRQFPLVAGDLVVSKIDARRGAMCVVPEEFAGAIVTSGFPTFAIDASVCDPAYLDVVVRSPWFASQCATISAGTTNRVSADMRRFSDLVVPMPPLDEQRRVREEIWVVDGLIASVGARLDRAGGARDQLVRDLLSGGHTIPVSYDRFLEAV